MHANKPKMAKKWEAHTPKGKKLPKKVKKKKKKTSRESFELLVDETLQLLFEEENEIQLGQSSNRTKMGATTGMTKGGDRPKHPKHKLKRRSRKK